MNAESAISVLSASPLLFSDTPKFSEKPGIYAFFYEGTTKTIETIPFLANAPMYVGKTESSQQSRDANTHFCSGKTGSSTVRRSLGAILRQELSLTPTPRNQTDYKNRRFSHFKFDVPSEQLLTEWMKNHVSISFVEFTGSFNELDSLETEIIQKLIPPINIDKNPMNPHSAALRRLRKTCAELARKSTEPIPIEIQPQTKQPTISFQKATGKYREFWRSLLPEIKAKLKDCGIPQQIHLNKNTFEQLGSRKSYSFNIQYSNGQVTNNLSGSAVARDLEAEIQRDVDAREILRHGKYKISMDSSFCVWVREM